VFTILAAAAVKSAIVFALAWAIAKTMRRASAAARHLVWTSAAAVVIALPAVSLWVPALRVSAPQSWRETAAVFQVNATAPDAPQGAAMIRTGHVTTAARASALPDWRVIVAAVWAIGTALALLEMLVGYASIRRLRRSLRRSADVDGVELLEAPAGSMPMAAGIWKPAVFLPGDAAEWPDDRRRAVLAHELAHVRRGDAATQFLARIAVAMYWWNPLAWMAWREFLKERERAADDLVLASGLSAPDYATHLLEIARRLSPAAASMSLAMARPSQLEGRMLAILDSKANRKSAGRRSTLAAAACAIAVLAPLAAVRAQENSTLPADVQATIRSAQSQRDPAMLDKIASAAENQRNFDVARKVLEAALEIRGEISGKNSAEYGMGLLKLAGLELRQHGLLATASLYSRAAEVLQNRPEAAVALIRLGEIAMANKDLDSAAALFQKAQTSDPSKAAQAMLWLADVRARQGNADEADALFKSAIATEDPKSLNEAVAMSMYATFLKRQGRTEEAANYLDRAKQVYMASSVRPNTSPAGASGPYRIGGPVTAPRVLSKIEPEYSEEARLAALQGTVVLSVVIGADGMAQDIVVARPLGLGLDDKAVAAVSQWRFQPGTRGGEPVPVFATIEVNFRLL
jgi:TonB family protein